MIWPTEALPHFICWGLVVLFVATFFIWAWGTL